MMMIVIIMMIASYTNDDDRHHDDDRIVHTLTKYDAAEILLRTDILSLGAAAAGADKGTMGLGCVAGNGEMLVFSPFFPNNSLNGQLSFRI